MAEGSIKRLTDKGFGFITTASGKDLFFHSSALQGAAFEELRVGQRVEFTEGDGPKGPRAETVRPLEIRHLCTPRPTRSQNELRSSQARRARWSSQ